MGQLCGFGTWTAPAVLPPVRPLWSSASLSISFKRDEFPPGMWRGEMAWPGCARHVLSARKAAGHGDST